MAENADGEVRIATTLDTAELQKQLDDLKNKVDKTGKEIEKKSGSFKKMGDFIKSGGLAAAVGGTAAAIAIKKTTDALNDCAAAYRVQANAEKALEIAARNNPYLNDENVYNLRQFAGELQKMSEVGDEVSLNVMAQLAATGRTESEIIKIMSAAADMAAATGQDIGTVAAQLNATYNGNAGALARQINEIGNLTAAELEAGKAIDIIQAKYRGFAAEGADVENQLSNAWGDFKENIGRGWQQVTEPVKQFFLDTLDSINEAIAKTQNLKDAAAADKAGNKTAAQTKLLIDEKQRQLEALQEINKNLKVETNETVKTLEEEQAEWDKQYGKMNARQRREMGIRARPTQQSAYNLKGRAYNEQAAKDNLDEISKLETDIERLTAEYEALTIAEQAAAGAAAGSSNENKERAEYLKENEAALNEQIRLIKLKAAATGEEIDEQALYNAYIQSYIDLLTKTNDTIKEDDDEAKARLELIKKQAEAVKDQTDAEERLRHAQEIQATALQLLADEGAERLKLIKDINENELLSEEEKNAAIEKLNSEAEEKRKEHYTNMVSQVADYVAQTQQIIDGAAELMLKNVQAQNAAELASLDEKYNKGEVTESEYYEKRKELQKKAAQEEYKIKLFQWQASLATAAANIAEGVSKAIAQGGVAGLVTGALVGAAGAVQVASIMAAKPTPPSFYTGGIIGGPNGASMGGDNTYIHARAGEMVLNAMQQRNLWDMINGQQGRGGYNLTVNNTQSGRVDTNIKEDNNGLVIEILDKHINKGLSDGTFDGGLAAMNARQTGVKIL